MRIDAFKLHIPTHTRVYRQPYITWAVTANMTRGQGLHFYIYLIYVRKYLCDLHTLTSPVMVGMHCDLPLVTIRVQFSRFMYVPGCMYIYFESSFMHYVSNLVTIAIASM